MARRRGARRAGPGGAPAFAFARVEAESSIVRWFMSRHGGQVLAQFPGLLARLASEPCEVALVFSGDRVVALAAWTATGPGQAELLGAYCASLRLAPWAFLFGPQGPIAAAGVERLWLLADGPAQAKDLRRQGFQPTPAGPAAPGAARLERRIGAA